MIEHEVKKSTQEYKELTWKKSQADEKNFIHKEKKIQ